MAEDSCAAAAAGKRGRRSLEFGPEIHGKVEVLVAGGMSEDDIAEAIGVSPPTLRKYFRSELSKGATKQAARQRAMVLTALAAKAMEGNVAAAKAYLGELEKQAAKAPAPKTPVPKGKKEERQAAAETIASHGGKFAPPPAPRRAD